MLITVCPIDESHEEVDYLSSASCGVKATIIDFGLSRLDVPAKGAVWTALPDEVFKGVGKQWDVYRAMKHEVEDWRAFRPITNLLVSLPRSASAVLTRDSGSGTCSLTSSTRKVCASHDQRA